MAIPVALENPKVTNQNSLAITRDEDIKTRQRQLMLGKSIADILGHDGKINGNIQAIAAAKEITDRLIKAAAVSPEKFAEVANANGITSNRELMNTVWLGATGGLKNSQANARKVNAVLAKMLRDSGSFETLASAIKLENKTHEDSTQLILPTSTPPIQTLRKAEAASTTKEPAKDIVDPGAQLTNAATFSTYFKKAIELGAVGEQQKYVLAYALASQDGINLQKVVNARNKDRTSVFNPATCKVSAAEIEAGRKSVERINAKIHPEQAAEKRETSAGQQESKVTGRSAAETTKSPSVKWENWAKIETKTYDLNKHAEQGTDLVNRTFPGRFNDHISFLNQLGISHNKSYFIDIGPGLGDFQDMQKKTQKDYPGITSLEMAKAFPEMKVVALDLKEYSVDVLKNARKNNPEIGSALLNQPNVSILEGNGLLSLKQQIESSNDSFSGTKIPAVTKDHTVIVRACNSIDIYCNWEKEVLPALRKIAADFRNNSAVLFFNDRILYKPAGEDSWIPAGKVSTRGFNHNQQTTDHVSKKAPDFTLLHDLTLGQLRERLESQRLKELRAEGKIDGDNISSNG